MLKKILIDDNEIATNTMDKKCDQWGILQEIRNNKETFIYNHKEIVEISWVYHKKRMPGKFKLHWTY